MWLEAAFNGAEPVALPWQTLLAFIRITTHPRAVAQPLAVSQACVLVDRWLQQPNLTTRFRGLTLADPLEPPAAR